MGRINITLATPEKTTRPAKKEALDTGKICGVL